MDIVYLITNKTKNKFYVGSKKDWKGIDSYWGSSSNKDFWNDFETDEFVFEVLFEVERDENRPKKLLEEEINELIKRDVLKDTQYYNKCIPDVGFSTLGDKRPGVGGVPKGTIPHNKGKKGFTYNRPNYKQQMRLRSDKIIFENWKDKIDDLVELYESKPPIEGVGKPQRNGKLLPYDRGFSKKYFKQFGVKDPISLHNVLKKLEYYKDVCKQYSV